MFDAIDFKWNDEEMYKANYMQDPFNILTKENLDKLEKYCKKAIHYERKDGILEHQITLDLLYKYEEQQAEIEKKDKIIDEMANNILQFRADTILPTDIEGIKRFFERKMEE
ncbi:MAG: hypothetical protein HFJ55_02295 [Clostridia bacterium]|jgi:hypothetical protein|nr:hypothetical protein [Clostridia bacterium]